MAVQIRVRSFEKYSHSADQKIKDVTTTSFYKTTYEGSAVYSMLFTVLRGETTGRQKVSGHSYDASWYIDWPACRLTFQCEGEPARNL